LIAAVSGATSAALAVTLWLKPPEPKQNLAQDLTTRIEELEQKLALEREARIDDISSLAKYQPAVRQQAAELPVATNAPPSPSNAEELSEDLKQLSNLSPRERRLQALVDAGFSDEEAQTIAQQESEALLQNLEQQYQRRRDRLQRIAEAGGNPNATRANNPFREELGDNAYEKYLTSIGQPIDVDISSVLTGSAGEIAGLQHGDKITRYNGERVFNVRELNQLTLLGNEGETVVIEYNRDGETNQTAIPRGPIGIRSNNPNNNQRQR